VVKIFVILTILVNFGWGGTLRVATSANVSYAMDEILDEFMRVHPEIKVQKIVSSSGKLTAQIIHKAPFDVFLSADMNYPLKLYKMGLSSEPKVYAKGLLAIFSKSLKSFKDSLGLILLKDSSIKKIAVANPKLAPYGRATLQALKNAKLYPKIEKKIIFADSISQTLSYALRVCDAGIVAKSLLLSPKMKRFQKEKDWIEVDPSLYEPIAQGAVIIKESKDSREFFEFIFSKRAKSILQKYGYLVD
jgi:molybdate transport system substrate-binding protein